MQTTVALAEDAASGDRIEVRPSVQAPSGVLQLEIGGTQANRYDHLVVDGSTTLQGQVVFTMVDGFLPQAGDRFNVLNVSGTFGNMATASVTGLAAGWQFSQTFDPVEGMVVLTSLSNAQPAPVTDADFNGDGIVGAADLTNWKAGFGVRATATHVQGDADADLDVDGADFLAWQRQLGSPAPDISANAPIPEPATLTLIVLAAVGWRLRRRRSA